MAVEIWSPISTYASSPSIDTLDGYPEYPGYTSEPRFFNTAPIREAKRIRGVDFRNDTSGLIQRDVDIIENGRFDEVRRTMYQAYKRLMRLHFLALGPMFGWKSGSYAGDSYTNFAFRYSFAATGSGTSIDIEWDPTDPNDEDPRALTRDENEDSGDDFDTAIQPGLGAMDDPNGHFGIATVLNVEFLGTQSDGLEHAKVTLDKALNTLRTGYLYVLREHILAPYPAFWLDVNGIDYCKHAVKVQHDVFKTFAEQYPTEDMAAGVDGYWYCAMMNDSDTDLSGFSEQCSYTACPNYAKRANYFPTAADVSQLFLARGRYEKQEAPGSETWKYGRDDWEGLFQLLGFPIGYFTGGMYLARKDYFAADAVRFYASSGGQTEEPVYGLFWRTGDELTSGYDEFVSFAEYQVKRLDAGTDEQDDVGPISQMAAPSAAPTKNDPAEYGALLTRGGWTPGYDFEDAIGVRRLQSIGFKKTEIAAGDGEAGIQRIMPRRYATTTFRPDVAGTYDDPESEIRAIVYASPQALSTDSSAFTYTVRVLLPRFGGQRGVNPDFYQNTQHTKQVAGSDVTGTIASATLIDGDSDGENDTLELEFELGSVSTAYPITATTPDSVGHTSFDCGGNVVCGENAWEICNPDSEREFGDRQSRLYPGDLIEFGDSALDGIRLICIGAKAYGGSTDGSATAPRDDAPYIPEYVRTNYAKQDIARFSLEGHAGAVIREWIEDGNGVGSSISKVAHGAHGPATRYYDGSVIASMVPEVKKVVGATATDIASNTVWDPAEGALYIDASTWGSDYVRIWFSGYVGDTRKTYPCEVAEAMDRAVVAACDGYIKTTLATEDKILSLRIVDTDSAGTELHGNCPIMDPGVKANYPSMTSGDDFDYWDVDDSPVIWEDAWDSNNDPQQEWTLTDDTDDSTLHVVGVPMPSVNFEWGGGTTPWYGLVYHNSAQIVLLEFANRWRKADIRKAYLEVEMEDVTLTHGKYTQNAYDSCNGETIDAIDMLRFMLIEITYDDATDHVTNISPIETSLEINADKVTESGTDYWRGTIDVTDLVKELCDQPGAVAGSGETTSVAFMICGTENPPTLGVDGTELARRWVPEWRVDFDSNGAYDAWVETYYMEFKKASIGALYIQPEPSAMVTGADYNMNAETHADAPDLLRSTS